MTRQHLKAKWCICSKRKQSCTHNSPASCVLASVCLYCKRLRVHVHAFVKAWHCFMLPENNGDHMATEENAHKGVWEAHKPHTRQGGQGMEGKPSVQAYIAIKGTR